MKIREHKTPNTWVTLTQQRAEALYGPSAFVVTLKFRRGSRWRVSGKYSFSFDREVEAHDRFEGEVNYAKSYESGIGRPRTLCEVFAKEENGCQLSHTLL